MTPGHKFYVGQVVQMNAGPNRNGGPCEIVRLLPAESGEPRYEVKLPGEAHYRVAPESDLFDDLPPAA
jgi:hypothetical protein